MPPPRTAARFVAVDPTTPSGAVLVIDRSYDPPKIVAVDRAAWDVLRDAVELANLAPRYSERRTNSQAQQLPAPGSKSRRIVDAVLDDPGLLASEAADRAGASNYSGTIAALAGNGLLRVERTTRPTVGGSVRWVNRLYPTDRAVDLSRREARHE